MPYRNQIRTPLTLSLLRIINPSSNLLQQKQNITVKEVKNVSHRVVDNILKHDGGCFMRVSRFLVVSKLRFPEGHDQPL